MRDLIDLQTLSPGDDQAPEAQHDMSGNYRRSTDHRPAREIAALGARCPVGYFLVHVLFQEINIVDHANAVLSMVCGSSRFVIASVYCRLVRSFALTAVSIGPGFDAYITRLRILPGGGAT